MITLVLLFSITANPPNLGLSIPAGFDVSLIAGDDLVHDAFVMTVHPKGHILVGGRGYLKVLVDANGNGKAESATTILQRPDLFPMGVHWTEKELLFVSDKGVWSLPMDGLIPIGPPTLVFEVKAKGEHDAHAVKRGPDGWLYLMCGNMAGVDEKWASDVNSPVKKPVAGCLVRISPDGKRRQVVADGFRNAYDLDWNRAGDPFTYDSDNERCVSLPWYEGCRLYHIVAGANHGWQSPQNGEFWRKPPYFFDVAEPLADLGRGSPTGVVCYKHTAFPPKYRDGLFLLDWTFGKIYFAALTPSGASYDAKVEVFAKPVGDEGFAPVSAAVDPRSGDLLVAIGGRGTRGAVYRVRYSGSKVGWDDAASPTTNNGRPPMVGLAASSHPTSARGLLESFFVDPNPIGDRVFDPVTGSAILKCANAGDRVLQQLAWRLRPSGVHPRTISGPTLQSGIAALDRLRLRQYEWFEAAPPNRGSVFDGYAWLPRRILPEKNDTLKHNVDSTKTPRLVPKQPDWTPLNREVKRSASLAQSLPDSDRTRFWNELEVPGSLESWAARWVDELAAEESVPDLVHTLICLARCPLPEGAEKKIAAALLSLDEKLEKAKAATDRNWPLRIGELHQALAERLPTLNEEMVKHPSFGRPAHALFASGKSFAKWRPQAAARLLEFVKSNPEVDVTAEVVKLIALLPSEQVRPTMVALWERRGLRDELTNFFAANPSAADAARLIDALNSPRMETVERAVTGLEKLTTAKGGVPNGGQAVAELLGAADRSAAIPKSTVNRRSINVAGRVAGLPNAGRNDLVEWLKANHPAAHAKLNRSNVDWPAFQTRMVDAPWNEGNADRGKRLYEKLGCNACHAGSGLGPDLKGVASRFSRDDLFKSIVDPSKDVSDRYRTTQVLTKSGAVKIGLVIYEAAAGLLLQTAPAEMVRIPSDEIEEKRLTRTSIMPTGLLKNVSERELADLAAYLKTLK